MFLVVVFNRNENDAVRYSVFNSTVVSQQCVCFITFSREKFS